jgi:hypothetical protein
MADLVTLFRALNFSSTFDDVGEEAEVAGKEQEDAGVDGSEEGDL